MTVIDHHCDYSHNWCVRSCELGPALGARSAFVRRIYCSLDVRPMLFIPLLGDTARAIYQPNCRMEQSLADGGLIYIRGFFFIFSSTKYQDSASDSVLSVSTTGEVVAE